MRAKRAVVLLAILAFSVLTVSLSVLALPSGEDAPPFADRGQSQPVPGAPALEERAGAASQHEGSADEVSLFLWGGAVVSASGVLVSFLVFRVEVRKEKASLRVRKQRAEYYKDLRKYNAQLKGPPRDNT